MNGVALNEPEFTTDSPSGKGKALFLNAAKEQLVNIPYNPLKGKYSYSISFGSKISDHLDTSSEVSVKVGSENAIREFTWKITNSDFLTKVSVCHLWDL